MGKMIAPDSVGSDSVFLTHSKENEGYYLMAVTECYEGEMPTKDGRKIFDGFSAELEIIGGMNDGKRFNLLLGNGKLTHRDQGKSAAQKQFSFLVATDVCKPDQLGKEFEYDATDAIGSLILIDLALGNPGDDGKQYLNLNYSNVFHVDDPRVSKIKLDDTQRARVAAIKATYRHTKDYFEPLLAKKDVKKSAPTEKPNFYDL